MRLRTIIIPSANAGTRLLSTTKAVPKELLTVLDRPVLQFAIEEAIDTGAEQIIVVIQPDKVAIRDHLKPDQDDSGRLGVCGKTMVFGAALTDATTVDAARMTLTAFRFSGQRFDCGSHDGWVEAGLARQRDVKRQRNGALSGMDGSKLQVRINDTPPSARRLDGRATALEGSTI